MDRAQVDVLRLPNCPSRVERRRGGALTWIRTPAMLLYCSQETRWYDAIPVSLSACRGAGVRHQRRAGLRHLSDLPDSDWRQDICGGGPIQQEVRSVV